MRAQAARARRGEPSSVPSEPPERPRARPLTALKDLAGLVLRSKAPGLAWRLTTATCAPASAKALAISLPKPRLPPVTIATRLVN